MEIPKPPKVPDKSSDDKLIGYVMRTAWEKNGEALRYDEVRLVINLVRKYEKVNE
jgi:hypothetical protein